MDLARRLEAARARRGWTREALAYHSGVSWSAIAQIENGRRTNVRPGTLVALARALGVSVDHLLGEEARPLLRHEGVLYESTEQLVRSVAPLVEQALERGERARVSTTPAIVAALEDALGDRAAAAEFSVWSEKYESPKQAFAGIGAFAQSAAEEGRPWSMVVGEPVWPERGRGFVGWANYESLINLAFAPVALSVVCLYDVRACPEQVIDIARKTHPRLRMNGEARPNDAYVEPDELIWRA